MVSSKQTAPAAEWKIHDYLFLGATLCFLYATIQAVLEYFALSES